MQRHAGGRGLGRMGLGEGAVATREPRPVAASRIGQSSPSEVALPKPQPAVDHACAATPRAGQSLLAGEPGLLRRCIAESAHVCFVAAAPNGRLRAVNSALAARLGCAPPALAQRDLWSLLADPDAMHLRLRALHGLVPGPEPLLLTFIGASDVRFKLRCLVEVDADGLIVIGESPQPGHT